MTFIWIYNYHLDTLHLDLDVEIDLVHPEFSNLQLYYDFDEHYLDLDYLELDLDDLNLDFLDLILDLNDFHLHLELDFDN